MSSPQVSVLMPVFNGGRFLAAAVASVTNQTEGDFELLIIDDGSTDDSAAQAERFADPRIRLIRNEVNLGLVKTLNRGLAEARGEWIARCDADDLWLPTKLEAQFDLCRREPDLVLIGTNATLIDERDGFRGQFRTAASHELLCWDLCFRNPFVHSTVLFRRSVAVEECGGYHDIPAAEDYDLWSRIAARHRLASVPRTQVHYRLHESSVMAQENAAGRTKSYDFLKKIMAENLRSLASPALIDHLDSWLEPTGDREALARFWQSYSVAWAEFRRTHNLPLANATIGEHVLSMLYRQRRRSLTAAVDCLATLRFEQLLSLPWLRALGALRPSA